MKQTNERLCALAQKGDAAALDSLIDNNKSFIGKVANDLFRSMNLAQSGLNLDTDDLKQAGNLGLWEEHPLIGTAIYFHLTKGRAKKTEEQAMDNLWLELPWWFI